MNKPNGLLILFQKHGTVVHEGKHIIQRQGLICHMESKSIIPFYVTLYLMTSYTYKETFLPLQGNGTEQKDFLLY